MGTQIILNIEVNIKRDITIAYDFLNFFYVYNKIYKGTMCIYTCICPTIPTCIFTQISKIRHQSRTIRVYKLDKVVKICIVSFVLQLVIQ